MEPLWKGQECLTKVAKFGRFPCTILCKSCLFYPSWQATSFERPPSWVTFIEVFHCICQPRWMGHGQHLNLKWIWMDDVTLSLTLNVRGSSYLGLTRSISWLLMTWLLASPGHQHPWYWPCRIGKFLSYLNNDFNNLCHVNVEEWHKIQIYVFVLSERFSS